MPRTAPIRTPAARKIAGDQTRYHNRGKFNIALGVEAQGFCILP